MKKPRKFRVVWRDKKGKFVRKPSPSKQKRFKRSRVPISRETKPREAKPYRYKFHEPKYNLCLAADRQALYEQIIEDRKAVSGKLTEEQKSALRVTIDITGAPPVKRTKSGKKSRRTTTAFIGKRTFGNLNKLKRFLLLDSGHTSGKSSDNPFGVDWRKKAMCQYPKKVEQFVKPETRRQRRRIVGKYSIGE